MKFFSGFKKLFNKTITLGQHQTNDVVSFIRLRKGMIKIGSDLQVDEGYNLVLVHYNKVCDILNPGTHKFNEEVAPKLFRYSKAVLSNKGLFTPKTLKADIYYINLKEFNHYIFKTQERIVAYKKDEKVKIKLDGNFSFKVVDINKFMKALCNDYAIIRNKKIVKELCSTVGFEVSKALNKKDFTLDDYFFDKQKICKAIEESVNEHTSNFGVHVSKFFINHVIVPKKYELESQFKQTNAVAMNENVGDYDISKMVEERLNDLQKDLNIVYVNEKGDNIVKNEEQKQTEFNKVEENISQIDSNQFQTGNFSNTVRSSENINFNFANNNHNTNIVNNEPFVPSNQPEPNLFSPPKEEIKIDELLINDELVDSLIEKINKRKKQRKNNRIIEILSEAGISGIKTSSNKKTNNLCKGCGANLIEDAKFCAKCGKPVEDFVPCACCGAKNFSSAEICCVCKSKLN